MKDYCFDSVNEIKDIANQVGMRMDLQILGFDRGEFCIAIETRRAVVHVLKADPIVRNELIPLYHNSPFDTGGLSRFGYTALQISSPVSYREIPGQYHEWSLGKRFH